MPAVAAERLVAAVAIERHGDVLPRQFREIEARDRGRISIRLAIVTHQRRQHLDRARPDLELVVLAAVTFRNAARAAR